VSRCRRIRLHLHRPRQRHQLQTADHRQGHRARLGRSAHGYVQAQTALLLTQIFFTKYRSIPTRPPLGHPRSFEIKAGNIQGQSVPAAKSGLSSEMN